VQAIALATRGFITAAAPITIPGIAGTGMISLPLENLRTLLANSSTFQDWVGAAGTPEQKIVAAKNRIYLVGYDSDSVVRPFACISWGEDWVAEAIGGGASHSFSCRGSLWLLFEDAVAVANQGDHEDAAFAFTNEVGQIISDIESLAASSELFAAQSFEQQVAPRRASKDEPVDIYQVLFRVRWGP